MYFIKGFIGELEKYFETKTLKDQVIFCFFSFATYPWFYLCVYKPKMLEIENYMKCKKYHGIMDCEKCPKYPCYFFIKDEIKDVKEIIKR